MRKSTMIILVLLVCCFWVSSWVAVAEETLDGHWEGAIQIAGTELIIMVNFETNEEGLKATIDIPQQGATGLALTNVRYEPSKVHFELQAGPGLAIFDGELKDGTISGDFEQSGISGTFQLKRGEAMKEEPEPEEPLPYKEEEIRFQNEDITLAGTLTLPLTSGPHPAVVLITGSGAQNRDEELFGFRPFRIIADHFTRNGIAVLRYDDRGVGGSTGDVSQSTTEDFAGDVLAAVKLLQGRSDINPRQIGLLGHSEGGIVAPLAASRSEDIAFIILMAGTGVTGEKILQAQLELIMRADGATDAGIEKALENQRRTFEAMRTGEGWDEIEARIRQEILTSLEKMSKNQREAITDVDQFVNSVVEQQLQSVQSPWFKFFLDYDPVSALEEVTIPVLALFGELDLQVPAEMNKEAIERALEETGNPDHTTIVLPKANHLFQTAETGSPSEYAILEKAFVPGFLDLIADWILERVDIAAVETGEAVCAEWLGS
ncbi:MAG: alpha/beta hydrolase family protein [Candidatus Bipolaricaulia bacterium]